MSGNEYGGKFLLLSLTLNNYKSITNVIIIVKENINNETNLAKTQHESFENKKSISFSKNCVVTFLSRHLHAQS